MIRELRVQYDNECMFTVYWNEQKIAWCQWSPTWEMWRVLMLSDNRIHHVSDMKSVFDLCSDDMGC